VKLGRWLLTFLAFPVGGELAIALLGSLDGPGRAALGGLIVGAVLGGAQWLALRGAGIGSHWFAVTAGATAIGLALAAVVTQAGTILADVMVTGLLAGAAVGFAQAVMLPVGRRLRAAWAAAVSVTWALGWLATFFVIVDVERGYYVFGSSGAAVVTVATGLLMRRLLQDRVLTPPAPTAPSTPVLVPAGR
jgi:hypothetical protein